MANVELDPMQWAEQQFGACKLGDVRRTRRAVLFAAQIAANPDASTPLQTGSWAEVKAAYRLIDAEDVTFAALASGHWNQTLDRDHGVYLLLGATTELDFGPHRDIAGVSPVACNWGLGFLLHSGLMIDAHTEEVIGLGGPAHPPSSAPAARRKLDASPEAPARIGHLGQVGRADGSAARQRAV